MRLILRMLMTFFNRTGCGTWVENKNGQNWNRTSDTRIFSPLLYRLSYLAEKKRTAKWGRKPLFAFVWI